MKLIDIMSSWLSFFPRITISNLFEIAILAIMVYEILLWIKNTRAWLLLRGLLLIFAFTIIAAVFRFDAILWILGKIATIAVTALIIIFQPELRRALEQLGSKNIFTSIIMPEREAGTGFSEETIAELVKASWELARTRTGALMVIERAESLKEIEKTGIRIDGVVSSQLLINIFEHNTPLHDGAVVIRDNFITAATCYLPLSNNNQISKDLGTRHRAAIGISEITDSLTIVVSEETGRVSVASGGRLRKIADAQELKAVLNEASTAVKEQPHRFMLWRGRGKNEGKAD